MPIRLPTWPARPAWGLRGQQGHPARWERAGGPRAGVLASHARAGSPPSGPGPLPCKALATLGLSPLAWDCLGGNRSSALARHPWEFRQHGPCAPSGGVKGEGHEQLRGRQVGVRASPPKLPRARGVLGPPRCCPRRALRQRSPQCPGGSGQGCQACGVGTSGSSWSEASWWPGAPCPSSRSPILIPSLCSAPGARRSLPPASWPPLVLYPVTSEHPLRGALRTAPQKAQPLALWLHPYNCWHSQHGGLAPHPHPAA